MGEHVVRPAVRGVQVLLRDFHDNVYDDVGRFESDAWDEWNKKDELCQIAMTNRLFYDLILFLWTLSMMQEFRTGERFWGDISTMPACTHTADMIIEHSPPDGELCHRIVA